MRFASDSSNEHTTVTRPSLKHPHGVSCPGCIEDKLCNQCGVEGCTMYTGRCTNGRCRVCCRLFCEHATS